MRKILVLRGGALGDFLVTLPALALLRERWPQAEIELAGNAPAAELARARGLLTAVHSQQERRWAALYDPAPLPPAFSAWLGGFDLIVSFWPDPDGELRRRFPLHPGQRTVAGAALPEGGPAAAHYCTPLAAFGLFPTELVYPLIRHTGPIAADAPIVVHPGSGSVRKNWPAGRWRELLPLLPGPIELVLGEVELARGDWSPAGGGGGVTVIVQPPLETLVRRLARCRLFLGHDSGISHLAAAGGAPSVLLFGPTDPIIWAPPGPGVRVIRRGGEVAQISVDEVRRAAEAMLAGQG